MKNVTTHTGILKVIKRMPSSKMGNPRYMVKIDGWTCVTPVDSMIAYGITNFDGKRVSADIGTFRGVAMCEYVRLV